MKLYLDLCALKRPFDDRSQARVDAEARAVLDLLSLIADGQHELVWSPALTFENQADPDVEVREVVAQCASLAREHARLSEEVTGTHRATERFWPGAPRRRPFSPSGGCGVRCARNLR